MEVSSAQNMWLIPPHFALWIPARTQHQIRMQGPVSMRTLYLRPGQVSRIGEPCAVLHITPFLRELIIEVVRVKRLRLRNPYEYALHKLLITQLEKASSVPTFITLPHEERALAMAQAMLRNPAESKSLATLCTEVGISVRTIERIFRRDVGIDFDSWRRQVRLTRAVQLLVSGCSIKEVAFGIGYRQTSAFVEMFRRTFGTTPKVWISALNTLNQSAHDPQRKYRDSDRPTHNEGIR